MNIAIRADASNIIGTGHIMRCLALAEALQKEAFTVFFICRDLPYNLSELIEDKGFQCYLLPFSDKLKKKYQNLPINDKYKLWLGVDIEVDCLETIYILKDKEIDLLITDSYSINIDWEKRLKPYVKKIMVIDDLANRKHDCDIILDHNFYSNFSNRYNNLVPKACNKLLGPENALINPKLTRVKETRFKTGRNNLKKIERILIFLGGNDLKNITHKVLCVTLNLSILKNCCFDVILGINNPNKSILKKKYASYDKITFHIQPFYYYELLEKADLSIGAGGVSQLERLYIDLPSIILCLADNQEKTVKDIIKNKLAFSFDKINFLKLEEVPLNKLTVKILDIKNLMITKNKNILITSISNKVPLIKEVKKSINKINSSIKIIGADSNINPIGKYFVDQFWIMPNTTVLKLNTLVEYCSNNKIGLIIPTRDAELEFFATHKKILKINGISVLVSDIRKVIDCLDKLAFSKLKNINSIPCFTCPAKVLSDYLVVKERYGAGSKSIGLKLTHEQAIVHGKKLSSPIFQPFISGKEISVDAYITKKGKIKGIIMRNRNLVINGESKITTTFTNKNLENKFIKIIDSLKLYGHIIIQAIIDSDYNIHTIECNPRFGGASTLAIKSGLDSFYWAYLESSNISLKNYPFIKKTSKLTQVRYPNDYCF